MSSIAELEPQTVWEHFDEILRIPRGSKNEQKIREYVIGIARRHGLGYKQDATGNLVVRKPAVSGRESAAAVVLRCHLDMVNDKNADMKHDFDKDPIIPQSDGEYEVGDVTEVGDVK